MDCEEVVTATQNGGRVQLEMSESQARAVMYFLGAVYHDKVYRDVARVFGQTAAAHLREQDMAYDTYAAILDLLNKEA